MAALCCSFMVSLSAIHGHSSRNQKKGGKIKRRVEIKRHACERSRQIELLEVQGIMKRVKVPLKCIYW